MKRSNDRLYAWGKILILLLVVVLLSVTMIAVPSFAKSPYFTPPIVVQQHIYTTTQTHTIKMARKATLRPVLKATGIYQLTATEIDGVNAHLSLLPDPLSPVLTFSSVSIRGLQITHPIVGNITLTISATGLVTATNAAIKTSIFRDLVTALQSFTNKADLLILIAGGTVKNLTMTNVNLKVDHYLSMTSTDMNGLRLTVA